MGAHQRRKGRSFEQLVADEYRQAWPQLTVRRAWQAHKAHESDVVIDGHPVLSKLWTECNHADAPNPLDKLAQAERDIYALPGAGPAYTSDRTRSLPRYPVVVWRKSASRIINVTTRLWVLDDLAGRESAPALRSLVVTVAFDEWLSAIKQLTGTI